MNSGLRTLDPQGRPANPDGAPAELAAGRQPDFFANAPRSFAAPGQADGRIGVVDAGSNSVRLVVYEGGVRSPGVIHNEKVMCALGATLGETGRLNPAGRPRAMAAFRRFAAVAEHLKIATLAGVATAAIRETRDGMAFCAEVEQETGIRLHVASGTDEARLAAKGVLFGNPTADGVVVDLGGASAEFCVVGGGKTGPGVSTPLGPLRLAQADNTEAEIERSLAAIDKTIRKAGQRLYLVGGSWRALARAEMVRSGYPIEVLHEFTMTPTRARELARWARRAGATELAAAGVSENRIALVPWAARLLRALLDSFKPEEVMVSAFGLREGVCFEAMPETLRARDPLIAACEEMERHFARAPGFGPELADWVVAALPPVDPAEARLMRATALLADVNWRSHPDHRVEGAWETVMRVGLTDLGHRGRAIMGVALGARHKFSRRYEDRAPGAALLDTAERERAIAIGLALRLGCTLAAASPGILPETDVETDSTRFVLGLSGAAREMGGEEVEKRLDQVARHLGKLPVMRDRGEASGLG